ncbi:hypothetical protein G5B88_24165 [Herbaspirillum seropedicae]|uniref:hypothetical protein n=1 Tax=Herbaspirillum seropedicae TaxID=964 RepID=UPI0012E2134D|nr:hypothetical protein [Herbaspirillum seropedicae]UMU24015.1 hypothetical protein G5B88_24165 [Herbaspirillum seropedicae]
MLPPGKRTERSDELPAKPGWVGRRIIQTGGELFCAAHKIPLDFTKEVHKIGIVAAHKSLAG